MHRISRSNFGSSPFLGLQTAMPEVANTQPPSTTARPSVPVVKIDDSQPSSAPDMSEAPTIPAELELPATQFFEGETHSEAPTIMDCFDTDQEVPETLVQAEDSQISADSSIADAQVINDLKRRMGDVKGEGLTRCLQNMESPSPERAFIAFCHANDKSLVDMSLKDVQDSAEGLVYWAHQGLDVKAGGKLGQQFNRALKHMPQPIKDLYGVLMEPMKVQFRSAYTMHRNWDFVSERRVHTVEQCKANRKTGEYMNRLQLANSYGGAQFEEAQEDAGMYMEWCESFGNPMVFMDPILKKKNYFRIKEVVEMVNKESWKEITENSVTENIWQSLAAECRAKRNFAIAEGSEGWANYAFM